MAHLEDDLKVGAHSSRRHMCLYSATASACTVQQRCPQQQAVPVNLSLYSNAALCWMQHTATLAGDYCEYGPPGGGPQNVRHSWAVTKMQYV
jgi:hypothetical protein